MGDFVSRQVVGRVSSLSKLGVVGSARLAWTSAGRFQASPSAFGLQQDAVPGELTAWQGVVVLVDRLMGHGATIGVDRVAHTPQRGVIRFGSQPTRDLARGARASQVGQHPGPEHRVQPRPCVPEVDTCDARRRTGHAPRGIPASSSSYAPPLARRPTRHDPHAPRYAAKTIPP